MKIVFETGFNTPQVLHILEHTFCDDTKRITKQNVTTHLWLSSKKGSCKKSTDPVPRSRQHRKQQNWWCTLCPKKRSILHCRLDLLVHRLDVMVPRQSVWKNARTPKKESVLESVSLCIDCFTSWFPNLELTLLNQGHDHCVGNSNSPPFKPYAHSQGQMTSLASASIPIPAHSRCCFMYCRDAWMEGKLGFMYPTNLCIRKAQEKGSPW